LCVVGVDEILSLPFVWWQFLWEKRLMGKLTARQVADLRTKGRYGDGDGLMLDVRSPTHRYWTYRYMIGGRARSMTFGSADRVSLTEARRKAAQARGKVKTGIDPLAEKDRLKAAAAAEAVRRVSFREAAEACIMAHKAGWRSRSEQTWHRSLASHAYPVLGHKPIDAVTVEDVLRVLQPIWVARTVTATAVRSRIELVLDYARARGWRSGENVATWRGNLRSLLPPPAKVHRIEHHAALDWREAPALLASIPADGSMAQRCLRFLVLTAVRSGEARGCRWDEIDLDERLWTLPAERMKAAREHRVPLSGPAIDLLRELAALRCGDLVFIGRRPRGMLADVTLKDVLRRLGHDDITVHGFRSTFRDFCADTGKPGDVAEMALAHTVGSQVARAYQRSDLLEQRRVLMQQWAAFLTRPIAEVIRLAV
jgi:integrase